MYDAKNLFQRIVNRMERPHLLRKQYQDMLADDPLVKIEDGTRALESARWMDS